MVYRGLQNPNEIHQRLRNVPQLNQIVAEKDGAMFMFFGQPPQRFGEHGVIAYGEVVLQRKYALGFCCFFSLPMPWSRSLLLFSFYRDLSASASTESCPMARSSSSGSMRAGCVFSMPCLWGLYAWFWAPVQSRTAVLTRAMITRAFARDSHDSFDFFSHNLFLPQLFGTNAARTSPVTGTCS